MFRLSGPPFMKWPVLCGFAAFALGGNNYRKINVKFQKNENRKSDSEL